jgi:hypothetical protein
MGRMLGMMLILGFTISRMRMGKEFSIQNKPRCFENNNADDRI